MSRHRGNFFQLSILVLIMFAVATLTSAATVSTRSLTSKFKSQKVAENQHVRRRMSHLAHARVTPRSARTASRRRHRYYERFYTSSFAEDITEGDVTAGEDLVVRQAAIDALGNMNGSVVAIEPTSGRILAMVNQKLALSSGAQPCSTIKLSVALAALSEGVIDKDTLMVLGRRTRMNLTEALARSNNAYFEALGRKLGFDKVSYYAHQYGLGELARSVLYNFSEEQVLGKTGTCSRAGTRYGWFASYANTTVGRIVTVVFLQGGRPTFGPKAAEIAGRMYRNLYDHNFFAEHQLLPADTAVMNSVSTAQSSLLANPCSQIR